MTPRPIDPSILISVLTVLNALAWYVWLCSRVCIVIAVPTLPRPVALRDWLPAPPFTARPGAR